MPTLHSRLEKLEAGRGTGMGRVFRVVGGSTPNEDPAAFLAQQSIILADNDTVIRRPLYVPSAAGPVYQPQPFYMRERSP